MSLGGAAKLGLRPCHTGPVEGLHTRDAVIVGFSVARGFRRVCFR